MGLCLLLAQVPQGLDSLAICDLAALASGSRLAAASLMPVVSVLPIEGFMQ
jgi:hypothetical protein